MSTHRDHWMSDIDPIPILCLSTVFESVGTVSSFPHQQRPLQSSIFASLSSQQAGHPGPFTVIPTAGTQNTLHK